MPHKSDPHSDLQARIDKARQNLPRSGERPARRISGSELGLRLVLDMAAALIAGLLLGWGIDWLLDSSPWGMLVGALLGIGAGIRNVMHTASLVSGSSPPPDERPGNGQNA